MRQVSTRPAAWSGGGARGGAEAPWANGGVGRGGLWAGCELQRAPRCFPLVMPLVGSRPTAAACSARATSPVLRAPLPPGLSQSRPRSAHRPPIAASPLAQERIENEEAYLQRAKQINQATSNQPARNARRKMYEQRMADAQQVRAARQNVIGTDRDQKTADASAKQAVHAQIHASKFVPLASIKATPERLKPYFSFRSPARRQKPHEVRL